MATPSTSKQTSVKNTSASTCIIIGSSANNSKKCMKKAKFLLDQEIPSDITHAKSIAARRLEQTCEEPSGYTSLLLKEACQCPHLERWLPHMLQSDVLSIKQLDSKNNSNHSTKAQLKSIFANPVHALHLKSQIDDGKEHILDDELYGEEETRTKSLSEAGIAEYSYPTKAYDLLHTKQVPEPVAPPTKKRSSSTSRKNTTKASNARSKSGGTTGTGFPHGSPSKPDKTTSGSASGQNKLTSHVPSSSNKLTQGSTSQPANQLSEGRLLELSRQEDQIRFLQCHLAKRTNNKKRFSTSKKRKSSDDASNISGGRFPGLVTSMSSIYQLNSGSSKSHSYHQNLISDSQYEQWKEAQAEAKVKVESWLENFRSSRLAYWKKDSGTCQRCFPPNPLHNNHSEWFSKQSSASGWKAKGDELMHCLECSFVGCSPSSIAPQSREHMLHHLLLTGHTFAVTCGPRAEIFCFKCGDFVYHEIFDNENFRIQLSKKMPWLAWKEYPLQRSFDPLNFVKVDQEYGGVVWRGLMATYPVLIPKEHVKASQLCILRQSLFEGNVQHLNITMPKKLLEFASFQNSRGPIDKWRVSAPVGMFNLGNTCFQSAILQCLMNCIPLQKYFLHDIGHHHKSCKIYRDAAAKSTNPSANMNSGTGTKENKLSVTATAGVDNKKKSECVCLACEMDILFLKYYGSTIGRDVISAIEVPSDYSSDKSENSSPTQKVVKGDPLITADMLTASWKSGEMGHLSGYEQRDAHEFLHAFLDILGKHARQHRDRVYTAINWARPDNALVNRDNNGQGDIIKHLFEGTLRSVLLCLECGNKRTLLEPFLNISLPLAKEVATKSRNKKLTLKRCLEHFTAPEELSDPVDCPSCGKKTKTKKQHTFSKLPKVLCVHLKRFDAALNKKIEDFVQFPAWGLNLGPHLPHWREVTVLPDSNKEEKKCDSTDFVPDVLYDLFGTVNHSGNLQSGHYCTNVKVKDEWFYCNDAHVSKAGSGDGEAEVLKSDGAYILFYTRRK